MNYMFFNTRQILCQLNIIYYMIYNLYFMHNFKLQKFIIY